MFALDRAALFTRPSASRVNVIEESVVPPFVAAMVGTRPSAS